MYQYILPASRKVREVGEAEESRLRAVQKPDASTRWQVKVLDEYAAREATGKAAREAKRPEEEDELREARRAVSAPTVAVIEAVKAEETKPHGYGAGSATDEGRYYLKLMAGLEPLIFGHVLPETEERLAAREAEIREEEEKRERERREAEARRERERLEREERYRREREAEARRVAQVGAIVRRACDSPRHPACDSEKELPTVPPGEIRIPEIPPPGVDMSFVSTKDPALWGEHERELHARYGSAYPAHSRLHDPSHEPATPPIPEHMKYRAPRWEGDTDY